MSTKSAIERLAPLCAEVGFALQGLKPELVARLHLLGELTETVSDSERMVDRARRMFRYYEAAKPAEAFSELERRVVVLGCLFSDIGKTGPAGADADEQRLIVEMFSVEGVRDDQQSVARFLAAHFPDDAGERVRRFEALGLDPAMTIREFWNQHSGWTLRIVETGGLPAEAIVAAATHHLLDDINPDAIVASNRAFTRSFGENTTFDRAEKLVILLDKYDALLRRGRLGHDQAIVWLRQRVETNARFRGDAEFATLIEDLDVVFRSG